MPENGSGLLSRWKHICLVCESLFPSFQYNEENVLYTNKRKKMRQLFVQHYFFPKKRNLCSFAGKKKLWICQLGIPVAKSVQFVKLKEVCLPLLLSSTVFFHQADCLSLVHKGWLELQVLHYLQNKHSLELL